MKKLFLLPFLALFFILDTNAQTLTIQPSTKLYGYKNSDGGWQIAPQFQYAYAFQGHFRRFAVVKQDRFWGCIDVRGQMRPLAKNGRKAMNLANGYILHKTPPMANGVMWTTTANGNLSHNMNGLQSSKATSL